MIEIYVMCFRINDWVEGKSGVPLLLLPKLVTYVPISEYDSITTFQICKHWLTIFLHLSKSNSFHFFILKCFHIHKSKILKLFSTNCIVIIVNKIIIAKNSFGCVKCWDFILAKIHLHINYFVGKTYFPSTFLIFFVIFLALLNCNLASVWWSGDRTIIFRTTNLI